MTETSQLYTNNFDNVSLSDMPSKRNLDINEILKKTTKRRKDINNKIKDIYTKFQEIEKIKDIYPIDLYTYKSIESSENSEEYQKITNEYTYINTEYDMLNYKKCDESKIIYIEGNVNDDKNNIIFKKDLKINDDDGYQFSIDSNINKLEKYENIMEFLNVIDSVNKNTNKKCYKIQNEVIYSKELNTKDHLTCDNDLFIKIIKHTKYSYDIKNYKRINEYYSKLDLNSVYNNNFEKLENIDKYYSKLYYKNDFGKLLNFYNNYSLYFKNLKELITYYNEYNSYNKYNSYYNNNSYNKYNSYKNNDLFKNDFYNNYFPEIIKTYNNNKIDDRINNKFYDWSIHKNLSKIYNNTTDKKIIDFSNKFMNYINSLIKLCRNNKFDKDFKNFYERCKSLIDINDFNDIYYIYEDYYNKLNNYYEINLKKYGNRIEYRNFINELKNIKTKYDNYLNEMDKILKARNEVINIYFTLFTSRNDKYNEIIKFYNDYNSYEIKIFDFYLICDSYFDDLKYIIKIKISDLCKNNLESLKNNKNIYIKDLFDLYYMCKFYNVNIDKLSDKINKEKNNIETEIINIKNKKIYNNSYKKQTPLMLAVYLGNFKCAKIFINNINKLDKEENNTMIYYLKSLNTLGEDERIKIKDLLTEYIKYPDYIWY